MAQIEAPADIDVGGMPAAQRYGLESAIASTLHANRTHIAASMLEHAIRRHELTVGSELLALAFVDRFAAALESHDWHAFFGWLERTCDKYNGLASASRLLRLGCPMVVAHVDDLMLEIPAVRTDFQAIADRAERIIERPRAARQTGVRGTLDEIDATLDRLMSRLTNFDLATAEHSRAVSMWCARVGKKMGLGTSETMFLMRAGLIHDIGKVMTPPDILNAPYRLSHPDMEIMRQHAEAGATIVSAIPQLEHLTPAVRGHHERIDGHGYPDGRTGSDS